MLIKLFQLKLKPKLKRLTQPFIVANVANEITNKKEFISKLFCENVLTVDHSSSLPNIGHISEPLKHTNLKIFGL